jgi:metal-responsive CopG/Arc/MetJ family transcriptional regulator
MSTEKITLNVSAIDLANVDLLVENGFASNRSELMKTAIKQYLNNLDKETKQLILVEKNEAERYKKHWIFGIQRLSFETINHYIEQNERWSIVTYGMLIIDSKITLSQMKQCIDDIKVFGAMRANKDVRDFYKNT